jgi:hypothetical protein
MTAHHTAPEALHSPCEHERRQHRRGVALAAPRVRHIDRAVVA